MPWMIASALALRDLCSASSTTAELYIDMEDAARNKALFDALNARKDAIEAAFGGPLTWERLDEKRASRVCFETAEGWADESTWGSACERVTDAMVRLYNVIGPHVRELNKSLE